MVLLLCASGDFGGATAVRGCSGRGALQRGRNFGDRAGDAMERVLTDITCAHAVGARLSGLTGAGSLVCSRALVTEWFLAQRESGYMLAGDELD